MSIKKSTDSDNYKNILDRTLPNVDIVKHATVQFDGKQFMIKLPKEIAEFYDMKKGDTIELVVCIDPEKNNHTNTFEVIHDKKK